MRLGRRLLLGLVLVVGLVWIVGHAAFSSFSKQWALPPHDPVEVVWLQDDGGWTQNWTPDDWQWFYHASQGGSMELPIPYRWMMAMERPAISLFFVGDVGGVMEPEHISRYGFLPNPETGYDPEGLSPGWQAPDGLSDVAADADNNPDRLPVGFARTEDWVNERTGDTVDVVGFTCAACHTGQINYQGTGIRIDGGPAMTDLGKFRTGVGVALALTYYMDPFPGLSWLPSWVPVPNRFDRFAQAVLCPEDDPECSVPEERKAELKTEVKGFIDAGQRLKTMTDTLGIYPTEEGFARLDAIGRIGNFVFAEELDTLNFAVSDAPVNFPHIWDTPWLDWVQYNASFSQPIMRNAGEAMGVFASVNFDDVDDPDRLFRSTIDVVNLHEMESLIRGPGPYAGLRSPEWPEEILGPLNQELVDRGEGVYREVCAGCHGPPITDSAAFMDPERWTEPYPDSIDPNGHTYFKVHLVNLWDIGTDPVAAINFYERTVRLGELGEKFRDSTELAPPPLPDGITPAAVGLPFLIIRSAEKRYEDLGLSEELRREFDGFRPPVAQAVLAYKARPLNGVWATAPFLHNGAVPTLHHLLGPADERPDRFWLGTKEFDPDLVGYRLGPVENGFLLDTSVRGNSNAGHRFCGSGDPTRIDWYRNGCLPDRDSIGPVADTAATLDSMSTEGVIGRALGEDREAVIEFLKSLPNVPGGASGG